MGMVDGNYIGNPYYYVKNLQGDVVKIVQFKSDNSGYETLAEYKYDAWGKIVSITDGAGNDVSNDASHIANINPFRYRSYYYDKEDVYKRQR